MDGTLHLDRPLQIVRPQQIAMGVEIRGPMRPEYDLSLIHISEPTRPY